jgi:hypothetical protein
MPKFKERFYSGPNYGYNSLLLGKVCKNYLIELRVKKLISPANYHEDFGVTLIQSSGHYSKKDDLKNLVRIFQVSNQKV